MKELVYANEGQKKMGWVLDVRYLGNIQDKVEQFEDVSLEEIEAVLLVATGQENLLKQVTRGNK